MRRAKRLSRRTPPQNQFASMSHEELAALAREKGVKGVPERMLRATIIEKLLAL